MQTPNIDAITIAAATLAAEFQRELSAVAPRPAAPRYDDFAKCHAQFVKLLVEEAIRG